MKRTTKIEIETHQVLIIRQMKNVQHGWCAECAAPVRLIASAQAVALTGVKQRQIFRCLEAGELHWCESPEGLTFICLNSLLRWLEGLVVEEAQGPVTEN